MRTTFLFLAVSLALSCDKDHQGQSLSSPNGRISARVWVDDQGQAMYSIVYDEDSILDHSELGVVFAGAEPIAGIRLVDVSAVTKVDDTYESLTAKRRHNSYHANERVFKFRNAADKGFDVTFRVSDDGVAFRYYFPSVSQGTLEITEERTSFHFPEQAKAWLQPIAIAKSGWEQTNPSYEEHYQQEIPVGTPEPTGAGWVYPALFRVDSTWILITEAGLDGAYCATRLQPESPEGEYRIDFPDPKEVIATDGLLPESEEPFYSPWRVIAIGTLATIVESTLGLDVAAPAMPVAGDFVKPGKSSWSWINSKDNFIVYDEQKKYIDYAADMGWQYCLIDVNWDEKIGYDKIKDLADYAATKNVGLLLWYNSAGHWNTVKYTPKDKLLTHESRDEEFARIKAMGIKGVKIDFFGGDGRSVVQYYIDILNDAAKHDLLVNFHGATLPRGWSRTYPHLMTVEAVRGFEMVTFEQADADKEPTHAAMLPFTRNVFDPMDFTPMNLNKVYTHVQRRTTAAFELATSVLFLSGIQHYAESPEGMATVPNEVKNFLHSLPDSWDDIRFLSGYPGKEVVIARKAGNRWYIAGINGEAQAKDIHVDLTTFKGTGHATLFTDGDTPGSFRVQDMELIKGYTVALKPNGGFVLVLQE